MRISRINISQNSTDLDPINLELIDPVIRKVHKKTGTQPCARPDI